MIHELILVSFRLFGVVLKQVQFTIRGAARYSQSIAKSGADEHLSYVIVHCSFVIEPKIAQ